MRLAASLFFILVAPVRFVAARGSRPAGGYFPLLAQMKVTKAKGLNTDLTGASGYNPRTTIIQLKRSLATDAPHPRNMSSRAEQVLFVGCCHGSEPNRISPFALATFIWGRK
jgi:hypothetical protein